MTRIVKNPQDRKIEILNAALELFLRKGFEETSVHDIVNKIGVAQGTFYYYFKSKEDVVDAIIEVYIKEIIDAVTPVGKEEGLSVQEKLVKMARAETEVNFKYIKDLYSIRSVDIHARIISKMVDNLAPIYAGVLNDPLKGNISKIPHYIEFTEIIISASHILFDFGLFSPTREKFEARVSAITESMEILLSLEKDSLKGYRDLMMAVFDRINVKNGSISHKHQIKRRS